jgi:hypothetical protein
MDESNSYTYSAISAPPMRGFLIRAMMENDDDRSSLRTKQIPIVGVVVRTTRSGDLCYPEIFPVIHEPCWADAPDGGLRVFDPEDEDTFLAFSTVWCWWPVAEDDERLHSVHDFVIAEGHRAIERKQRRDSEA